MLTRGIGRGITNGRGGGDISGGIGTGSFGGGGGDSSIGQNGVESSFGRGRGRGNSSFGLGAADSSFGQAGEDSSFGRGVSTVRGGVAPSSGRGMGSFGIGAGDSFDRGLSNGRGGGHSSVGRGGEESFGRGGGESSIGRGASINGRGGDSSVARGGGNSSFGSNGRGMSNGRGGVAESSIGRGTSVNRGGGDSFARGGSSSAVRGGGHSSVGRGMGTTNLRVYTPRDMQFGTGSNSVEVQQNARSENYNDNFNNGEMAPQNPAKDTTANQNSNNNGFNNSDEKPISRGFALRERLVDDLYKDDEIFKQQYVDIADADDDVMITGVNIKMILESWTELNMDPTLMENITVKCNYIRPRKIQKHVIPYVISGHDLKGHSETGSGKTGAFLIPIIQKILSDPSSKRQSSEIAVPFALVLSPTRELCLQIYDQCRKFANGTFIKVTRAYGQFNFGVSLGQLKEGCDILIATTGRLLHLIKDKYIDLSELKYFVLDEADRMLESNFLTSIREILESPNFPPKEKRQTMIFSATFPPEIEQLANEILRPNYVIASNNKPVSANNRVKQSFLNVEDGKTEYLKEMLEKEVKMAAEKNPQNPKPRRTLVFVETRRDADRLAVYLHENGIKSLTLNGERKQSEREMALRKFDRGFIDVLVATDVCARGIDIKGLEHVINYDLPQDAVTYVHRIGRAGRLVTGYSTSFVDLKKNSNLIPELIKILQSSLTPVPEFMAGFTSNESTTYIPYGQNKKASTGFENGVQNHQNGFDNGGDTNDAWDTDEPEIEQQIKVAEPFIDTALVTNAPVVDTTPIAQSVERSTDYWASAVKQPPKASNSFVKNVNKPNNNYRGNTTYQPPAARTHVAPVAQTPNAPVAQTYTAPVVQTYVAQGNGITNEDEEWDKNDNWEDIDKSWA
ncbi:hypothetical protein ACQ4LE_006211 [Meloidogyne hapla]